MARFLDTEPQVRVVTVSLNDNRVRIYERLTVQGQGLEALTCAIGQASGGPGSERANGEAGQGP